LKYRKTQKDMKNATGFKAALKANYGIEVKTTELQKGCIGIQHDEADTLRVRFTAKKMGLQYMTADKYKAAYCSTTKANTVIC